jgi:hypothetical protein
VSERWRVQIEVLAEAADAARLRKLLPEFLHGQGYTTTSGTTTCLAWLVEDHERPPVPFQEHVPQSGQWLPRQRLGKRMGHRPSA